MASILYLLMGGRPFPGGAFLKGCAAGALAVLAIRARGRKGRGGMLFLISDSLLVIDSFKTPIPLPE